MPQYGASKPRLARGRMLSPKEGRVLPFTRPTLIGYSNALSVSLAIETVLHCAPVGSPGPLPLARLWEA